MLFLVLGSMSLAAFLFVAWPLVAGQRRQNDAAKSVSVFKAQLEELEADVESGLVEISGAETSRVEIERRILDAASKDDGSEGPQGSRRAILTISLLLLTAISAGLLYNQLGAPEYAGLQAALEADGTAEAPFLARLERTIEMASARIDRGEGTIQDWATMGQAWSQLGEHEAAIAAFEGALNFEPENGMLLLALGESKVLANQGAVTPDAAHDFRAALEHDPELMGASFYLALGLYQEGDKVGAYEGMLEIAERSPPNAPWMETVRLYLTATAEELGISPPDLPRSVPETANTVDDATIIAMVERLSTRLHRDGGSAEDWVMLGRSYTVLERFEDAANSYAEAIEEAPTNLEALEGQANALLAQEASDGFSEQTIAAFESILEADPVNDQALYVTGIAYAAMGESERARKNFEVLLQNVAPGSESYKDILARLDAL